MFASGQRHESDIYKPLVLPRARSLGALGLVRVS